MKRKEDTGFAAKLKAIREERGLTQQQLADACGMNVFGVAKLEQGVSEPYWPSVLKLAAALGVSCEAFAQCDDVTGPGEEPERSVGKRK